MSDDPSQTNTMPAEGGAGAEAHEIIQQMETLVDVESGLAQAHLAVEQEGLNKDDEDVDGFLDAADDVEGALEAAIVPPPDQAQPSSTTIDVQVPGFGNTSPADPAVASTTTTIEESTGAVDVDAAVATQAPEASSSTGHPMSQAAVEAEQAIEAVNADIPVPILPEQVDEPAHDVVMETTIEEETSSMQIDTTDTATPPSTAQEQTQATIPPAPVEEEEDVPRPRYDPSEPQEPIYVASASSVPTASYDPSIPQTEPAAVKYDPSEPQTEPAPTPVRYDPSEPQTEPAPTPVKYDPSEPQQAVPIAVDPRLAGKPENARPNEVGMSEIKQQDISSTIPQSAIPSSMTQAPPPVPQPIQPYTAPPSSSSRPLPELPADITPESPSVVTNQHLVNIWRNNTSDMRAVLGLFDWSVVNSEINDARAWFAVISKEDPTAWQPLLSLTKLELALNNFDQAEALFGRALAGPSGGITTAADVHIWRSYLHYIRRKNPVKEGPTAGETRAIIVKAYDFALEKCGMDRESGEIWQEYLEFLASSKASNEWEEQQKQDALRAVYQKAVCIPLNNVEQLWKAYDAFENSVNKQTAKRFLAERSPAYMTARTALRELRQLTEALPNPSIPPKPSFSDADRAMVSHWKTYLKWEEGNPLSIDDKSVLATRMGYALRKCLGIMRHFSELWQYAATHYFAAGEATEALAVLKAGIEACPKSVLLTFAYTDAEEQQKNVQPCHEAYERLINNLSAEVDELKTTIEAEVEAALGPEIPKSTQVGDDDNEVSAETARLVSEREARGQTVKDSRGQEVEELQTAITVVWIMYMRFARRSEGIKIARNVFGRSRKSPHLTWHVFEASAMLEYHSNKEAAVAIKIWDLGLKRFPNEVDFVIRHLQFLLSINDDTNARALFEKSALNIPAEKARPLWDAWARYEYMYGDLATVTKLEARFAETFPNDPPLKRFAQRFSYNGIDEIALRDLGFNARTRAQAGAGGPPPPQRLPPPASFPPPPNVNGNGLPPAPFQRPPSPIPKRPAPSRSPPPGVGRRPRVSRSPDQGFGGGGNKRFRPSPSYDRVPPPRERDSRFDERDNLGNGRRDNGTPPPPRNRYPSASGGPPYPPVAAPVIPPPRASLPPRDSPVPVPPPGGPDLTLDPSGLTNALVWFVKKLPSSRSFDGPTFRPDDIMGLFDRHIGRDGKGTQIPRPGPGPGPGPGYAEPQRFPPPAMGARRY